MKISFDKSILNNLEININYEWLEHNQFGAYASSSIIGLNTRREHGLLNVPHKYAGNKINLLSKLEESVFVDNRLYELSTSQYEDSVFPRGYQLIEKFELDPFPTTYYRIEDRLIKKTIFLLQDKNVLVVRYELKNQGKPIKLIVKPFLASRGTRELAKESQGVNTDSYLGQSTVRWSPKPDVPELIAHFNRGEFVPATLWYRKFYYMKDKLNSHKPVEDLMNPGFFQAILKPYQSLELFIGTKELSPSELDYESVFRHQAEIKCKIESVNQLSELATKFENCISGNDISIPLSYMGSDRSLRNLIFVMPTLLENEKGKNRFHQLFSNILNTLDQGILPLEYPASGTGLIYKAADISLWLINLSYLYYQKTKDRSLFTANVVEKFNGIIAAYTKGTSANIYTDNTGLLFSGNKTIDSGWLPLKSEDGSVLRFGYLLETNALWYNALKIMEFILSHGDKKRAVKKYTKQAQQVRQSFNSLFINNGANSFYDFINNGTKNEDFRLNQVIPLCLPFPVADSANGLKVLNRIEEELVTSYGLRVISEKQINTKLKEIAHLTRDSKEFFTHAVWPWTILLYVKANMNLRSDEPELKLKLSSYFQPLFKLYSEGLINYFPEAIYLTEHMEYQFGIQDSVLALGNIIGAYRMME